jgi:Holliday junction resolvase YEN1
MSLVPIDLSIEDEDDQLLPPADADEPLSEADNEWATMPSSTAGEDDDEDVPATKTRGPSLYDPTQPEKLWLLADFLRAGCPVMLRMFEDGTSDPKAILKARREARAKAKGDGNIHAKKSKKKAGSDMPANALMAYTTTIKSSQVSSKDDDGEDLEITRRVPLKDLSPRTAGIKANKLAAKKKSAPVKKGKDSEQAAAVFRRVSSQLVRAPQTTTAIIPSQDVEEEDDDPTPKPVRRTAAPKPTKSTTSKTNPKTNTKVVDTTRPFKQFAKTTKKDISKPSTPRRNKRSSNDIEEDLLSSAKSQRTIDSYWTPTPKRPPPPPPPPHFGGGVIDLVSSSPAPPPVPLAGETALQEGSFLREEEERTLPLPKSVTKRKARRPLKRAKTAPVAGGEDNFDMENINAKGLFGAEDMGVEAMDLASPSPVRRREVVVDAIPVPSPPRFSVGMPPPPSPQAPRIIPPVVRSVAAAPLRRSPRPSALARASSSASILPREVPKENTKKQRIQLRESLEGSWRYVEADMLDLTGDVAGGEKVHGKGRVRSWRESGVEVLDLTED